MESYGRPGLHGGGASGTSRHNVMADVYVTLHRPSNVDNKESLSAIMGYLEKPASKLPVCFPIHPRTKKMLATYGIQTGTSEKFKLIDPVGYHDSICLAEHARFVLTDSGGLQEETTFFQTPCLTLRPNTERPVTVTEGSNKLTDLNNLWPNIKNLLNGNPRKGKIPALWDGRTADRIVRCMLGSQETGKSVLPNGSSPAIPGN